MSKPCHLCRGSGLAQRAPRRVQCWTCKGVGYLPSGGRLTFPAPRRVLANGVARQWTTADVLSAQSAGCYFLRGRHEFADAEAEVLALGSARTKRAAPSIQSFLKKLSKHQLAILKEILSNE